MDRIKRIDGVLTLIGNVTLPLPVTPINLGETVEINNMIFPIIAVEENIEFKEDGDVRLAYTVLTYVITPIPESE